MKVKNVLAFVLTASIVLSMFTATYISSVSAVISPSDLLLDLDFSNYNGEATVTDKTNSVTVNVNSNLTKATGRDGKSALKFNGSDVIRWWATDYDPFALTDTGVTISIWYNAVNGRNDWTQYFAYANTDGNGVLFQTTANNAIRPNFGKAGSWGSLQDEGYTGDNTWIMATFVQDYTTKEFSAYVNGELKATGIKSFTMKDLVGVSSSGQYTLGGPAAPPCNWDFDPRYHGVVESLQIYGRALTAGEIVSLYDPSAAADTEAVNNTITLINAIGTINSSAACLTAIRTAQSAYDALSQIEKELVTNAAVLHSAFDQYSIAYANDNGGKMLYMDFEGQSLADAGNRVTAAKDGAVTFVAGKESGTTAAHFIPGSQKQGVKWTSANYDPFTLAGDNVSFSTWVYLDSAPTQHTTAFMLKAATGGDDGFVILKAHPDVWEICVRPVGGSEVKVASASAPAVGKWTLITYTQSGNTGKVYINDQLEATKATMPKLAAAITASSGFTYDATYALGCQLHWGDPSLPGAMDDFAIYNKTLSILDVANIYGGIVKDDEAINAVKNKIDAIGTVALSDESLNLIKNAQAAYDILTDVEKTFVTNYAVLTAAWDSYYTLAETANDGKMLFFDFENGTAGDTANRVNAAVGSSVTSANGFTSGSKSLQFGSNKSRDDNMKISWNAKDYDPFARSENGVTISTWVKTSEMNDWTTLFSYGKSGNALVIVPQCGINERNKGIRAAIAYNGTETDVIGSRSINAENLGEWTLITFTQDTDKVAKLYINDELVGSATLAYAVFDVASAQGTAGMTYNIGYVPFFSDNNFQGSMEEFSIYNTALSAEKIAAMAKVNLSDYTLALSQIPADLTSFTAATVTVLNTVVAEAGTAVSAEMLKSRQTVVDDYTAKIRQAVARLIEKSVEMQVTISEGMVAEQSAGVYSITWNARILTGEDATIDGINGSAIQFKSYGVYYGTGEEVLADYKNADASEIRQKIFEQGADIDVYTMFGFRLKNVNENAVRAAMFYVEYELNGQNYIVLSTIDETVAILAD